MSKTSPLGRLARRFARNNKGSIATLSALALIPITIAAGAGIDVSRAMMGRGALQDALDATALALAHMPTSTPAATLQTKGQQWLSANLANAGLGTISLTVTSTTGKIVLDATSNVPTVLSSLAGISNVPVKAHSEVKWGLNHVELALVLDNTGSMAGTKLATLKTAANALVDTLVNSTDTSEPNALKISVVPFSMTVNIGSSYQGQWWLDGKNEGTPAGFDIFTSAGNDRFQAFSYLGEAWKGCVESRPMPYDVQDTAPSTLSNLKATKFVPYFAPDEPDDTDSWHNDIYANNYIDDLTTSSAWNTKQGYWAKYVPVDTCKKKKKGVCVQTVTYTPEISGGGGPNEGCDLAPIQRLTTNVADVRSKLNAMVATGNTNIPMGMMWGWHTLSPNAPFSDGVAYTDTNTKKIMVVLTDGDNVNSDAPNWSNQNNSTYSGIGYIWQNKLGITSGTQAERTAAMDGRMTLLCSNAKAAGITIYTVRVAMTGGSSPVLQACASDTTMFYDVPNIANLSTAFDAIAGSIGKLRISQ